jgi:glycosyltransferase involved in cell wall biosynthesis
MKILIALTYYRPHVSGLTIYAERLARALAVRGHTVTILTSRHNASLPLEETQDGVHIIRAPVIARVSKGVLMPTMGLLATRLIRSHDVVSLHLPQFDASGIALRGRLMHRPTVLTYHCDLLLPPSALNRLANRIVDLSNGLAGRFAHAIVAYTEDYARNSRYLSRFMNKVHVIPPPVELPDPAPGAVEEMTRRYHLEGARVIGFAARLAREKGVEVLVEALPRIWQEFPNTRVLFAGEYQNVLGEAPYAAKLAPAFAQLGERWSFLGVLNPFQMAAFYRTLDCLVLPSLNSTESFGLVQVEAMLSGTPSVASNLPGVRQPVLTTGMGEIAPIGDAAGLAEAVLRILRERDRYLQPKVELERLYHPASTARAYEDLFHSLLQELSGAPQPDAPRAELSQKESGHTRISRATGSDIR